jgi:hypothetical protein
MILKLLQEDASFRHEVRLLLLQDIDLDALKAELSSLREASSVPPSPSPPSP